MNTELAFSHGHDPGVSQVHARPFILFPCSQAQPGLTTLKTILQQPSKGPASISPLEPLNASCSQVQALALLLREARWGQQRPGLNTHSLLGLLKPTLYQKTPHTLPVTLGAAQHWMCIDPSIEPTEALMRQPSQYGKHATCHQSCWRVPTRPAPKASEQSERSLTPLKGG